MRFRFRAFFYHLLVSGLAALLALWLIFVIWYPSSLSEAVGVTSIFLILLCVDVIVGPLMTLLVAKEGKKSLKFDLMVIVIIQLAAFAYGMGVIASGRPVWIVFAKDRFDVVRVHEIEQKHIDAAEEQFKHASWFGPQWIAARLPQDQRQLNDLVFESVAGGADLAYRPDSYVDYESELEAIKSRSFALSELYKYNVEGDVKNILSKWPEASAYLPLMARKQELTVLINKQSGKVISIVPLKPW
jgi:hypothetical protein